MMQCKHGLILYGNKCLNCEREKREAITEALKKPTTKIAELMRLADLARVSLGATL